MANKKLIPPSPKEWGIICSNDIELRSIYTRYLGKTNKEIQELISSSYAYIDDLRWMPPVPFYYYIDGAIDFILTKHYKGTNAIGMAEGFFSLVKEKLEENPMLLNPIKDKIHIALNFILNNLDDFLLDDEKAYDYIHEKEVYIKENL